VTGHTLTLLTGPQPAGGGAPDATTVTSWVIAVAAIVTIAFQVITERRRSRREDGQDRREDVKEHDEQVAGLAGNWADLIEAYRKALAEVREDRRRDREEFARQLGERDETIAKLQREVDTLKGLLGGGKR
jgi:ribosome-binding protein aMBF1 (putative translation factor)